MTKQELSQLYYLNREIEQLQKQLDTLRNTMQDLENNKKTTDSVKGSMVSFPYVLHSIKVEGLKDIDINAKMKIKSEIADIVKLIEINQDKCIYEYNRLNRYISDIRDSQMRQILTYRYINGYTWEQVAAHISHNLSGESVRKAHERFLQGK